MNESEPNPLREQIAALPRAIAPARDLWPEIAARLPRAATPFRRFRLPLAIAAALGLAAGLHWLRPAAPAAGWNVSPATGTPTVGRVALAGPARIAPGQWLETDATSSATLDVGGIGEVRLEPNSRLRVVNNTPTDHRLELARGTLSAFIWAPPRLFFVETPSATAIDLGCAYTLTVDDTGAGALRVTSGYVALEHAGREAFIPAGLMCLTRPGAGPGTPFAEQAAPALRDALHRFDFSGGGPAALPEILAQARPGDEITLWHLLSRVASAQRAGVFDRLAALQAPPAGVTREGIIAGDPAMRLRWAGELGLGPALATR